MIVDLRELEKCEIEFELHPMMWVDKEGYLRLCGEGIIKVEDEPIAKIKFKDSTYDPSIKVILTELTNKKCKGIKSIINDFNDRNNVEFLGREIAALIATSDLVYRTTLEEAYIG